MFCLLTRSVRRFLNAFALWVPVGGAPRVDPNAVVYRHKRRPARVANPTRSIVRYDRGIFDKSRARTNGNRETTLEAGL